MDVPSESNWLSEIRRLTPRRELSPLEIRYVLEHQAVTLLRLAAVLGPPVPVRELAERMSHVTVRRARAMPVSGRTQWIGHTWVIFVTLDEPATRQRFTLGHELAHVVLHPFEELCLPAIPDDSHERRLETACDWFSACLLMPRPWMKRAFFDELIQDPNDIARLFEVSYSAVVRRLRDLGIAVERQR